MSSFPSNPLNFQELDKLFDLSSNKIPSSNPTISQISSKMLNSPRENGILDFRAKHILRLNDIDSLGTLSFLVAKGKKNKIYRRLPFKLNIELIQNRINIIEQNSFSHTYQLEILPSTFHLIPFDVPITLFTERIQKGIGVCAIGYNSKKKPIFRGLCHLHNNIQSFKKLLDEMIKNHCFSINLYVSGGYESSFPLVKRIKNYINEFEIPIFLVDDLLNPFNIKNENEILHSKLHNFKIPNDLYEFSLEMGMTKQGEVYVTKNSLFENFDEGIFEQLRLFFSNNDLALLNFVNLCKENPETKDKIVKILIKILLEKGYMKSFRDQDFLQNIKQFLHEIQLP